MSYRYLVLVGNADATDESKAADLPSIAFMNRALRPRLVTSGIRVFAPDEVPTLIIPNVGIIIGHLFSNEGKLITEEVELPNSLSSDQIDRHILEHYWGEYLLLRPTTKGGVALAAMRDPSGGLPCIYSFTGGDGFIVSDVSLATALGLLNKQIDWAFIAHCLAYPHLQFQRTALLGVHELLPGCTLEHSENKTTTRLAWSPWKFVAPGNRYSDFHEAASDIRRAVTRVVQAWAGVDKSMLLELSGGLDSSIVGVCLDEAKCRVACHTVVTPVPGADERQYAGQIAHILGADLQVDPLNFENAKIDFAPRPPTIRPSVAALQHAVNEVMEAAGGREGVDHYYSGGGGDTVFGYLNTAAPAADAFIEKGLRAGLASIRDLSELHRCTWWKAAHLTINKLTRAPKAPCKVDISFLNPAVIPNEPESHPWLDAPQHSLPGDRERISDLAGTQTFREGSPRSSNARLRMPLLSQPVVESCLKTPSWMNIRGGVNRAVARTAFADVLPQEIVARSSKGNFVQYYGGVYQRNKGFIRDFLLAGHLHSHGLLDSEAIDGFIDKPLSHQDLLFLRMFDLCMIENWVRHQAPV